MVCEQLHAHVVYRVICPLWLWTPLCAQSISEFQPRIFNYKGTVIKFFLRYEQLYSQPSLNEATFCGHHFVEDTAAGIVGYQI